MSKKLYLHIGFHKTGSSSIQVFLRKNWRQLQERDIFWLDLNSAFLTQNPQSAIREDPNGGGLFSRTVIDAAQKFDRTGHAKAILSSEFFPAMIDNSTLQYLRNKFDVSIIVYIRNPIGMREAGFQQSVKACTWGKLWPLYSPFTDLWTCEFYSLERFIQIYGVKSIFPLAYDQMESKNALLNSFIDLVDLGNVDNFIEPERENERLSYDFFLFLLQSLWLPLSTKIRKNLYASLIDIACKEKPSEKFIFIPKDRHFKFMQRKRKEIELVGEKLFSSSVDWYSQAYDFLLRQKEHVYRELPLERQQAIYNELPDILQSQLQQAMPLSLRPLIVPPLIDTHEAYVMLDEWVRRFHSILLQ